MAITLDDQLELVTHHIARERDYIAKNRARYHSGYIAKLERNCEIWETIKETVRKARADQQMTTMSGAKIT